MSRKVVILLFLAGFPLYSCTVSKYQASDRRSGISKPVLRPPRKGGSGHPKCLVTMHEEARRSFASPISL